ncbi:hypothetical protein BDV24DRAFT_170564 [Aspergillus arachidicola]|uniref:Uncharacterized protein n=1 Tax=Aspergillus arachidicola TaxID=656916 RepID=A0A5N6XMM2_9EURO|nr:hypothetical protein BDV24DRAFT_170564 [Aspergillus arachidicola]
MRYSLVAAVLVSAAQALPLIPASETIKGHQEASLTHYMTSDVGHRLLKPAKFEERDVPTEYMNDPRVGTYVPSDLRDQYTERYVYEYPTWKPYLQDKKTGHIVKLTDAANLPPAATAPTLVVPQAAGPRWKEPDSSKCRDNKSRSEDCLGTQQYCALGASSVKDGAKREKARKDCEASRGGRPSGATTTGGSSTAVYPAKESKQAKPDIDAYDRIPI